jgi:Ca2+-binding RTX toxin-like protein
VNAAAYTQTNSIGADITGTTGANTITGTAYADTIRTGAGADTIIVATATAGNNDFIDGGADSDTLQLAVGSHTFATNTNLVNVEAITLGNGTNTLDLTNQTEAFTITGGTGADTITGGDGADVIRAGAGADAITAGAGADTIILVGADTSAIASTNTTTPGTLGATEAFTWGTASGYDVITGFTTGDMIQLYTTGTTAIVTSTTLIVAGGVIPAATVGVVAAVRGTQTNATTFTAATTGLDTLLLWDTNGTTAAGTYAAVVLVGYTAVANDTISAAGLFTAVA